MLTDNDMANAWVVAVGWVVHTYASAPLPAQSPAV